MVEIRRIWWHEGEGEAMHLLLTAGEQERHGTLSRAANAAVYDFISAHAAHVTDPRPAKPIPDE